MKTSQAHSENNMTSFYQSADQLYATLAHLFDRLDEQSDAMDQFGRSNLVIRIRFTDLDGEILLDGRHPTVFYGERPGRGDLELHMSSDLLHRIWLGEESLRKAFFSGDIKSKGNVFQAMGLAGCRWEKAKPRCMPCWRS